MIKKGVSPFFSYNTMNFTLPILKTDLARRLIDHMQSLHDASSLTQPLVFDVHSIDILHTIKSILTEAQIQQHKVFIAGDYDADGLCSTAMMVTLCKSMGLQVGYYIPHRLHEGYGLKPTIAKQALEKGYDVFICVDNGVSAIDAIQLVQAHQKKVIIIDHHTITQPIDVDALLHPQLLEETYASMCTSGLVYLLAKVCDVDDDFMIQCAGVATVADMMPLVRMNRYLVIKALESMNKAMITPFALLLKKQSVNEDDLGFTLIPKINAIGRMAELANANTMVNYLCSSDLSSMVHYASKVESINEQRKHLTKSMALDALDQTSSDDAFVFVVSESYHEGIVGLIANQLMRQLNTNVFVGVEKEDSIKGSMRAYNVHLIDLIKPYESMLIHFGGHAKAAGCEIRKEDFEAFKANVLHDVAQHSITEVEDSVCVIDPSLINKEAVMEFESCRPFGVGWERTLVRLERMRVMAVTPLKGGLSKGVLSNGATTLDVFALDASFASCKVGELICVEGTLGINTYNGIKSVQFTLTALKSCQDDSI